MNLTFKFILLIVATFNLKAFAVETHCANEDQIVFNCTLKNSKKIISACRIGTGPLEDQYLEYNFGAPGKVELSFPKDGTAKKAQFSYLRVYSKTSNYLRYDLTFKVSRNEYNVYWEEAGDMDDVEHKKTENRITNGVSLTASNGKAINLLCGENAVNNFDVAHRLYNVKDNGL